ncbi:hypothetical protein [Anaerocellum danielii]|uniref:Uncharacterized protein n=1 Tax=Anaerocellum danielii TaxID=1387557 RepID=A0ABZ0TX96_9FIRM|nr:hypothetical protein [Caldicellulosiruptor danielii]WPX08065.1 hypothetical protein SOJ16_001917 [Caldicellulosiruptor danielii]
MKRKIVALLVVLVFGLSIILPVFAEQNTSSSSNTNTQTVASATYDTTASATYQTTVNTTYEKTTYEQTYNPVSSPTSSSTSSTTYSSTYSTTPQEVIPPISNDNISLKEAEKLTKEQKKNIISLIFKINRLKATFNKINAEVNHLRAKINSYITAAQRYDKKFFDQELQRIINETNKLISQIQRNIKSKKLSPSQIDEYQKQLAQKLNELKVYQETYKNEKETTVAQAVYQIKLLVDQVQPVVKDKVYQIDQINAQIKVITKEYEQAKKENNYTKMVTALNSLITLYQQKVDKITEIKNLYTDILTKIGNIIKDSLKLKLPVQNKNQNIQKEQNREKEKNNEKEKNININGKGKGNIEINIKIVPPQKGKKK